MVLAHNIDNVQRTEDIQINQDATFDTMMLSENILNGLLSAGFHKPSPIQLQGIPLGKLGLDLLLEAKSGTGKTVVFSTIALEKLDLKKGLQVIIITPTREIAVQIHDVLNQIGSKCEGLIVEVAIGGLSYQEDIEKMQGNVHILVGTPGRLKHLIQDKHIETSATRLFILDEADKLLEKSFQDDIKYIHAVLPKQKQVILSSATYPDGVMEVIHDLVKDAQHVCPSSSNVLLGVSHRVTYVKFNSNSVRQFEIRFAELIKILSGTQFKQCVIFCKYQAHVSQLHKKLSKAKWPSDLVYGKQDQIIRLGALKTLQEYKCRILIATDLVSRGIDAKNIDLVINFEPPDTCETYLHRIGRSGRYGSIGMAISIVREGEEQRNFHKMLEPIMNSIDLRHFWNRKLIIENVTSSVSNTKTVNNTTKIKDKSNDYENLWNFLVGDTQESDTIESFDQLCQSYNVQQTEEVKFASSSNLIGDGKDNGEDKIILEFNQIKCDDVSCKDYLSTVRRLKENLITKCTDNNSDCKTSPNNDKLANLLHSDANKEIKNTKIFDVKKCNEKINVNENSNNHERNLDESTNYIDTNDFILQLPKGLQVSSHKKLNTVQSTHDAQKILFNSLASDVKKEKQSTLTKKSRRNKSSLAKKVYDSENVHGSQIYEPTLPHYPNIQNHTNKKKTNNLTYSNQTDKTSFENDQKCSYFKWYNNLKSNMKQIEHFIYIEEMSRLD